MCGLFSCLQVFSAAVEREKRADIPYDEHSLSQLKYLINGARGFLKDVCECLFGEGGYWSPAKFEKLALFQGKDAMDIFCLLDLVQESENEQSAVEKALLFATEEFEKFCGFINEEGLARKAGIENIPYVLLALEYSTWKRRCVDFMWTHRSRISHLELKSKHKKQIIYDFIKWIYTTTDAYNGIENFMELFDFVYTSNLSESYCETLAKVVDKHYKSNRRRIDFDTLKMEVVVHCITKLFGDDDLEKYLKACVSRMSSRIGFHPINRSAGSRTLPRLAEKREGVISFLLE